MGTTGAGTLNLGPRLTLTFAALIILILGGNALVVWQFQMIRDETDRLTGANQQLIAVLRLQTNILSFHRRLDELARSMDARRLVTETESLRGTLREQTQQIRTAIANLPSGTVVNPSFLPTLDTIDVSLPGEIDAIVELAKSGDWGAVQLRVAKELSPNEDQTAILVDSINRQASGELARAVAERRSIQRRILIIVPATALSTFFIAAFFGWSIARRFIELRLEERVGERLRIARELHDTLLQSFQGLVMKLYTLTYALDRPAEARKRLEDILEQSQQALDEGRNAVLGMRSSTVIKNDLARALAAVGEKFAGEQNAQTPADFRVVVDGGPRDLHPILRDEVYRIASEATCNAFRHSGAGRIEVEICYSEKQLRVRVQDNGKGMDTKVLDGGGREGHYGLRGMQERARLTGGKLTVRSRPNSGTEVELTIPASLAYAKSSAPGRPIS
jgi:signal transduction histidine kinase